MGKWQWSTQNWVPRERNKIKCPLWCLFHFRVNWSFNYHAYKNIYNIVINHRIKYEKYTDDDVILPWCWLAFWRGRHRGFEYIVLLQHKHQEWRIKKLYRHKHSKQAFLLPHSPFTQQKIRKLSYIDWFEHVYIVHTLLYYKKKG